MSSKNKKPRGAKRAEKSRKRAARRNNVIPLRPGADNIDVLMDGFDNWLEETNFEADVERRADLVAAVQFLYETLSQSQPGLSITDWSSAEDLDAAFNTAEFIEQNDVGAPPAVVFIFALRVFVDFLVATGKWTGGEDGADFAMGACEGYVADKMDMPTSVEVPDVEPNLEFAELSATQIVLWLDALLDWIGPGQPTTEESLPEPELLPELFEELGVDPPEEELTSLSGHPLESQVWDLAEAIGLIEADTSQVRPGEFAEDWRPEANGLTAALDIRRRAVAASVTFLLTDPRIPSDEPDEVVARIVYQGLMPVNIPLEAIDEIEEEDELLGALVKARLTAILVDGWLVIDDDKYVVPEALRPAVWAGFPDYLNPELGNDQAMITVRADMPGITPPVWRTLRLHSWVRLDELHDVLQIVFDWEDAHLHQFIVRHTGHVHRYMPEHAIRQGLHPAADTEVEERIRIGELLAAPGDELIYEYDFGDDWTVRLVVEQIEQIEPENDDPSATVLDGSGTAPFEDVGGAGGWDEFLEAINDPEHPRYQELREWTGMPERIQLDPTLFDVADVNRLLLDPDM
ncbi:plasmid pRiA4b ORF-3 family protein [Gordonia sp. NPDC003585]|uniref:plasmid pRiA4b ORF-3 family protein n=1 Tax=Gordonia sp. NPDC003585 TaxID=3154275 RepID=UPI0033AACC0A